VLVSLTSQRRAVLDGRTVALFQDGSKDVFSGASHATPAEIRACVATFSEFFPQGVVHVAEANLGVAMNFDRAERYVFETLAADAAIFLEDDLVLSEDYIATLDALVTTHLADERVGYLSAYGDHKLSLEKQRQASFKLQAMHHNWGFALYRRQWLKMRPYVEQYLQLVRHNNYRKRDHEKINALFASWGYGSPATSQDSAKTLACCLTRTIKVNTKACFAHYIGERGLHMNPQAFKEMNYAGTEVFPDPVEDFEPITDLLYYEIRADLLKWAGRPQVRQDGMNYQPGTEKLFHQVNGFMAEQLPAEAKRAAGTALTELFTHSGGPAATVEFLPRASIPGLKTNSAIWIESSAGSLHVCCPDEMVTASFTNHYHAFVLASDVIRQAAADSGRLGGFAMDLGNSIAAAAERQIAFSAPAPHGLLVLDPDFYATRGYDHLRGVVRRDVVPWRDRRNSIFWRGPSTGRRASAPVFNNGQIADWSWLQRLHLCDVAARSRNAAHLDVGLSALVQIAEPHIKSAIQERGFLRGAVEDSDLMMYRHLLVLDGNSSFGNGLMPALLTGACVLLVGSRFGYRSWYYGALAPWETHVPVKADLSDLEEKIAWVLNNPEECERIAARGAEMAHARTFETERLVSVQTILGLAA